MVPSNLSQGHGAGAHARLAGPRDARGPPHPAHAVSSHQPRSHGGSGLCSYHDNTLKARGGQIYIRSARIKKKWAAAGEGDEYTQHQRTRKSKGTASCNAGTARPRCFCRHWGVTQVQVGASFGLWRGEQWGFARGSESMCWKLPLGHTLCGTPTPHIYKNKITPTSIK